MDYCIKFRPNRPAAPHLNGKVERSQRTDKEEFYPTVALNLKNLEEIHEWQTTTIGIERMVHLKETPIEKFAR